MGQMKINLLFTEDMCSSASSHYHIKWFVIRDYHPQSFTMSQAYCVRAKYFRPSAAILTCTHTHHCIWPTKASCIRYEGGSSDCECHHFYKARHISGACVFALALFHSFPGRAFLASGTASSVYSIPCEKRT